jgi:serine/threonine protein kinase
MDAGSLVNVLQRAGSLPEPVLGRVATQVLEGLAFLHTQRHTMHRDIKPGNILLNYQGKAKVRARFIYRHSGLTTA